MASTAIGQDVAPPPSVADWARVLEEGHWSASVRLDLVRQDGLRDSRSDVSAGDLFASGYTLATDESSERSLTVVLARGLPECTLFVSLPVVGAERSGRDDGYAAFDHDTAGVGDLEFGMTRTWRRTDRDHIVWSVAASLPTGSVDETEGGAVLPYAMQPGSGTVDVYPAAAWTRTLNDYAFGLAARGRLPLGENSEDWARSGELRFDAWIGKSLSERITGRAGLRSTSWGDIYGESSRLDPLADPLADSDRQGGTRTDLFVGIDRRMGSRDLTLSAEIGVPIDEWLDGPQPSTELLVGFALRCGW